MTNLTELYKYYIFLNIKNKKRKSCYLLKCESQVHAKLYFLYIIKNK